MHAIVTVPLADIRRDPAKKSSLEHQVLLGENVHILSEQEGYYAIRTFAERYPGWIKKEDCRLAAEEYMGNVIVAEKSVSLYVSREQFLSVSAGTYLDSKGKDGPYLGVRLPDGKYGLLDPEAVIYGTQPRHRMSIISTAKELSSWEIPYLWGGVSPQGIDCSGLMKLILRLNGFLGFPRDSHQQYVAGGEEISVLSSLLPGDLVFFTALEKEPLVTHVGMMIDTMHFVHASKRKHEVTAGKNCISISSFTSDPLFGDYYKQYFLGGKRFFYE